MAENQNQLDEAIDWYRWCLDISEKIGYENGQVTSLHRLGNIAESQNNLTEAENWYRKSLTIHAKTIDDLNHGFILKKLGNIVEQLGRISEAAALYYRAELVLKRTNNKQKIKEIRQCIERIKLGNSEG